jgi:predicted ribosome quality control (RQC) complex YloA/Tae2 family protein
MKTSLSSIDLRVLVGELDGMLAGSRFDKAYSLSDKGMRLRFHSSGLGSRDVVVEPEFLSVTSFEHPQLESPGGFAMSLRKHLEGLFLRSVEQHELDRIVEFYFEGKSSRFTLVAELFSKGNVILLDEDRKIVSILERQAWKDRILTPKSEYKYPPSSENPFSIKVEKLKALMRDSEKNVASVIASLGLGGFYAEEICLKANVDKTVKAGALGESELERVYEGLRWLLESTVKKPKPSIVLDANGDYLDVIPFDFETYRKNNLKSFPSFNNAVDEYFSHARSREISGESERSFKKKEEKLLVMKAKQGEALERLKSEAEEFRRVGDLIYQNLGLVENIVKQIESARGRGLKDEEINQRFSEGRKKGIPESLVFKRLERNTLILEL